MLADLPHVPANVLGVLADLASVISAAVALLGLLLVSYGTRERRIADAAGPAPAKLEIPGDAGPHHSGRTRWTALSKHSRRARLAAAAGGVLAAGGLAAGVLFLLLNDDVDVAPLPRAVDPCSLLDDAVLTEFGEVVLDSENKPFDECGASITAPPNFRVNLTTKFKAPLSSGGRPPGNVEQRGGVDIGEPQPGNSYCEQVITVTDDGTRISIRASRHENQPVKEGLCEVAETATEAAVSVLETGRLVAPQRPRGSLSDLNACKLLDTTELFRVLGLQFTHPTAGFRNWSCQWNGPDVAAVPSEVRVAFTRDAPPQWADRAEKRLIAGRPAQVVPGGFTESDPLCLVEIQNRAPGLSDTQRTERLRVRLLGPQ